jgi:hypothetical protein
MTQTMNSEELKVHLQQFNGTENYYEHRTLGSNKILLTDGCQFLREIAKCYWLFDVIASYQRKLKREEFQTWTLKKMKKSIGWKITATDGNDKRVVTQTILYSDFTMQEGITLFLIDGVVMLPSEY